ncbi:MAG: hypothetical protein K0U78_02355, partial [Actinomycetia bacterium]|nr:hypothetical protein [Actinomycetes bacterium]
MSVSEAPSKGSSSSDVGVPGVGKLVLAVVLIVAGVELAIMIGFSFLPELPMSITVAVDMLILAALSAPLWFFVVKSLYDEVLHREKELHAQLAARRMDGQILRAL